MTEPTEAGPEAAEPAPPPDADDASALPSWLARHLSASQRQTLHHWFDRLRRWLPWISLAMGVLGALLMDRSPRQAWWIAGAAAVMWGLLGLFIIISNLEPDRLEGKRAMIAKVASFSALVGSQSLIQLCLFFAMPFYWQAATLASAQFFFILLLVGVCGVSLWDPAYEALFRSRVAGASMLAFATFAALNCIFPILGLSNRVSLYGAAVLTSATIPGLLRIYGVKFESPRRRAALDVALAALFPLLLAIGGAALVPPAPLSVADAAFGTRIEHKWVVDPIDTLQLPFSQLVCATAIAAPRGLKDELVHRWIKDGEPVDEIALNVTGGREDGFRTWSIKRHLGRAPEGEWVCEVRTASGQLVGRTDVEVEATPSPEDS